MLKKLILLLLIVFTLAGCTSTRVLSTPKNIVVSEDSLSWDAVEDAEYYVLIINQQAYIIYETTYSFSLLDDGNYSIYIKAKAEGFSDSELTDEIYVTIARIYPIPQNISIEDGMMHWDNLDNVLSYMISINDETFLLSENSFNLQDLPENAIYFIKVKALYDLDKESSYSEIIKYHTFFELYDVFDITFSKNTSEDYISDLSLLTITINDLVDEEDEVVDNLHFAISDKQLTFRNSFLTSLPYGVHTFFLQTSEGLIRYRFTIVDDRKPYLISSNSFVYELNTDIELEFCLFDGVIIGLSGNGITASDYTIDANKITISATFVSGKFTNEPDRKTLILGYQLEANTHVTIGYLFIQKPISE